jgi:hypothetical protein
LDIQFRGQRRDEFGFIMATIVDLDAEYRRTRAALVDAGVDMTDSIDAIYRDWRRWRDKLRPAADTVRAANADRWWTRHLEQFRSLIDPLHTAARAERARKDQRVVRSRHRLADGAHSAVAVAKARMLTKD